MLTFLFLIFYFFIISLFLTRNCLLISALYNKISSNNFNSLVSLTTILMNHLLCWKYLTKIILLYYSTVITANVRYYCNHVNLMGSISKPRFTIESLKNLYYFTVLNVNMSIIFLILYSTDLCYVSIVQHTLLLFSYDMLTYMFHSNACSR